MVAKTRIHETNTMIGKTALTEHTTGADITLKVRVKCTDFCDLRGSVVKITDQDAAIREIELTDFNGVENRSDEFVVHLPDTPGTYTWTAVFPVLENDSVHHLESTTRFSFTFKPHAISIAVWELPSPIVINSKFQIKVGVKCSANCALTGKAVEVYDQEGVQVGTATLGDIPWSGASGALYWAEVELEAPGTEGHYRWTVKVPEPNLELPHEIASYTITFDTARQPEHLVTVEVRDKDTQAPIENAHVLLHPYSGDTGAYGVARVMVPKGEYQLYVTKNEYKTFQTNVVVASDITIKAELSVPPPDLYKDF
jgi:hypothetical protein